MKKILIILALVGATAFAFGFAGNVMAQAGDPPIDVPGFGPGRMGGGFRGGMMAVRGDGAGFMHDAVIAALSDKLGIPVDDLNTRLESGETMYDIAVENGMTLEDFRAVMTYARASALDDAVAAGTITQEQADFMKERGRGDGEGLLHDARIAAFAEKLGMTVDELNTRLDSGETLFSIAEEKGMTLEEFRTFMTEARTTALENAVADGTITQEQADFMKERGAGRMGGRGGFYGNCPMATQAQ